MMEPSIIVESRHKRSSNISVPSPHRQSHPGHSGAYISDSYSSSIDFPAYIPWQTLSSDLSDKLRQGSVRINRSNYVEWVSTIKEENERTPLLGQIARKFGASSGRSSSGSSSEQICTNADTNRTGASWKVASYLLVNAALGAGVLNYPVAYDRLGGITLSTFIQIVMILMLASTMIALVYCSDINKDSTYHDVLYSMCGKLAQQLSAASIMSTCFGICVTFLVIIGDQYDRLLATLIGPQFCYSWYFDRKFTISATTVLFIWPMCYPKRLDFLRYASTLGIFAMLYVVFLNIYEYYNLDFQAEVIIRKGPSNVLSILAALPVVCFAYQTHEIVVPIYACMGQRGLAPFSKATVLSLIALFIIYCASGTFGYLTFGSKVAPDIMLMYNAKDPIVAVGIVALVIKMITTYAPVLFCGRGALDGLYAEYRKMSTEEFINGEYRRRIVITTFWNIIVLVLSLYTPNITIAIELLGSLASCNVFIFPGLCIIALSKRFKSVFYVKVLFIYGCFIIFMGVCILAIIMFQLFNDLIAGNAENGQILCV